MMIRIFAIALFLFAIYCETNAQPGDTKTLQETARTFMRTGDFDNAIIVLTRALQNDSKNLELQKDLTMSFYLKRDFVKALEGAKEIIDRDDADVQCFQIAGNVYKALEQAKDCDKMYKKALKKFPKSGALLSEYGELLWSTKDFSAINYWEEGIKNDPAFGGNYYNAAIYYFYSKDKIWSLIYGEIFVNMESLSERGAAMKELLLQGYKEKLFSEANLLNGEEKNKNEFALAFLSSMNKQTGIAIDGLSVDALIMIRTRFILDWYAASATKFPYRLFDYHKQLLSEGMFEAYNQWLFGPTNNLAAYDSWTKLHADDYNNFTIFQKSRVFRMPQGQYYQAK